MQKFEKKNSLPYVNLELYLGRLRTFEEFSAYALLITQTESSVSSQKLSKKAISTPSYNDKKKLTSILSSMS